MTNFNEDDKTITIPEFMDEKDNTDSSVDMSIFKMSDEELYDDVPKDEGKKKAPKKKGSSTVILCLVVIGVLMAALVVVGIFAFKYYNAYTEEHDKITQVEASNNDLSNTVTSLQSEVATLTSKIEELEAGDTNADPDAKYKAGAKLYITEEGGGQGVREKADVDSDVVTKNGSDYVLYWGDTVTLSENAVVDSDGNYWGKIEGGYIRIEYDDEAWATLVE